ncbi:MAG: T9SS type A sorting domain-containing protein [Bacteroidia bacterium]
MTRSIKKVSSLILFMSLVFCAFAQRSPAFNIDLKVTATDSSWVDLSWNTPPQAIRCDIEYETYYATTLHHIPNFSLDSARIPRQSPIGPFEKFTITFLMTGGTELEDSTIQPLIYGGIVLVEEEAFAATVIDACLNKPPGADWIYFVEPCLVCKYDLACQFSNEFMADYDEYNNVEGALSQIDEEAYKIFVTGAVKVEQALENPDVKSCEEIFPDSYRTALLHQGKDRFTVSPNPFSRRMLIQPASSYEAHHFEINVMSIHGKVIMKRTQHTAEKVSLDTQGWPSGMYLVTITSNGKSETHKVIKQ